LSKALYRLKQAPQAWSSEIDNYLITKGFLRSELEAMLYMKVEEEKILILFLYIDDLLFTGSDRDLLQSFK
jgi:hypothetical protein